MDFAMDTSLYTIQPFDIHCSQYNFIDLDNSHFFVSPIHEEEIYRNAFPPLADHSTSSNTLKDHHDFYDDHLQSLVFLDSDINHSPNTSASDISPDSDFPLVQDDEIGCQGVDECSVLLDNDPYLSSIQEKLTKEGSITDLLLIGAQAVEAEKCQLASAVISRLTHLLLEPQAERSPFNRLALYFTQGLETKIFGVKAPSSVPASMPAFQMLQELTPYVKFPHFTANQAILEASKGETELHIIDFDVMEGIQWPPLMVDLALRKNIFMRITAVVDNSNAAIVQQTGRRLREFAESISLSFIFDQTILEEGQLRGVQLSPSSILIANCMFNQLHNRTFATVSSFLSGVTRLSPKMVILMEEELYHFSKFPNMTFVQFFCEALHHYSALLDSLITSFSGGYKMGLKMIEKDLLGRVSDCLRQFPNGMREHWRDGFSSLKGFSPIPMSFSNVTQAKLLVGLFHGGYRVQHDKCRLSLCWKSRPLTTASVWVPNLA